MIYMERHWEGKKIHEMIEMAYAGRYTILLMSIWSIYIGSLYNEYCTSNQLGFKLQTRNGKSVNASCSQYNFRNARSKLDLLLGSGPYMERCY